MKVFADADDLYDPSQIEKYLVPIKKEVPDFKITLYSIPNKLGHVIDLVGEYGDWITFAIHGWEHVPFECRAWTEEQAIRYIQMAREMGYAPVFKAPNWTYDEELVRACEKEGVILHHHPSKQVVGTGRVYPGMVKRADHLNYHTHITPNPVTDDITTNPDFKIERLKKVEQFLTIFDVHVRAGK